MDVGVRTLGISIRRMNLIRRTSIGRRFFTTSNVHKIYQKRPKEDIISSGLLFIIIAETDIQKFIKEIYE